MSRNESRDKKRAVALIDGFNLYHAIDNLGVHGKKNHLKWLDLRALAEIYAPSSDYDLLAVKYFSAFATWLPDAHKRHRAYVRALQSVGVQVIMGKFKEKDRHCYNCGNRYKAHEEKETDVNLAIHLLNGAYKNEYDLALIFSADSDLAPAIRMVRAETQKTVRIVFPVGLKSGELRTAAGGAEKATRRMKVVHLERSLFPKTIAVDGGTKAVTRPAKYDPS